MDFSLNTLLRLETAPALGCTEPTAVALAAAAAASLLPKREITSLDMIVDPNIYKNGLGVAIPGTDGACGLDLAAALGALSGDPAERLEVLASVNAETVEAARVLLDRDAVAVKPRTERGLYVHASVRANGHTAEATVQGRHDAIVSLELDGQSVQSQLLSAAEGTSSATAGLSDWFLNHSIADFVRLAATFSDEDAEFLQKGVTMNERLADYGLEHGSGLGVGRGLQTLSENGQLGRDMLMAAKIRAAAGADARLSGAPLPAMSTAGSGTQGVGVFSGMWAVREFIPDCTERETLKAIALASLVTSCVKAHIGRLSAMCGCAVASGAGIAAGTVMLLGGSVEQMENAVRTLVAELAGSVCDGAKLGCALKLALGVGSGIQAALLAMQGVNVCETDGLVCASTEQTLRNIGRLSSEGMSETDSAILSILKDK